MNTYDVYSHPTQGPEAVKRGFSWPGFFFNWIWALIKKLWGNALLIFGVMFLLTMFQTGFEASKNDGGVLIMALLQIGFCIWVGTQGNEWRKSNLSKRGFELIQTIEAETPDAAIAANVRHRVA